MCETFNSKLCWRKKDFLLLGGLINFRLISVTVRLIIAEQAKKFARPKNGNNAESRCHNLMWMVIMFCFIAYTQNSANIWCRALNMLVSLRCDISLLLLREVSVSSQFIYEQKRYTHVSAEVKKIGLLPLWYVNQKVLLFTVMYYKFLKYIIFWRDSKVNPK